MTATHTSTAELLEPTAGPANSVEDHTDFDTLRRRLMILVPPTIVVIVISWRGTSWWAQALITAWTAYFFLCATSLFHEFTHRHDIWRCRMWARIIGTFILTPARSYRETHMRHHAYMNRPVDWELWPYSSPNCSRTFRLAFAWADLVFGIFTSPYIYGRVFFHRDSPLAKPVRREIAWEYLAIAAFWTVNLTLVTVYGQWGNFFRAWCLPWLIAGVLQTGRKFTEHLGMASYEPLRGTRTVFGGNLFTRVCSWLNSDLFIHGPHHRSPKVTADELNTYAREVSQGDQSLPFYKSYRQAVGDMLPHLLRNPGIGENATR